jgi:hypothetical protein
MYVCSDHEDFLVPLLPTFAFGNGCKYWCPYCNKIYEKGISLKNVETTEELEERYEKYKDHVKPYINAMGIKQWTSVVYAGKRIKPKDLPKEEIARLKSIVDNWNFKIKL